MITIPETTFSQQQLHILVVDDNPAFLELIQLVFVKDPSFIISTTTNATEILSLLQKQSIDVIITDYKMPDMDGITLAEQVRKHGYKYPIILLTSYTHELIEQKALDAGISLCLEKQGDIFQLYLEILHYLQEHIFVQQ